MKVNNRNVHMLLKELMFNQGSSKYLVNKLIMKDKWTRGYVTTNKT